MTRTLTEADLKGGSSLLPSGVRDYNVFGCRVQLNKFSGMRELLVEVASSEGSGDFTIPLEKPQGLEEDTFMWIFGSQLGALGFEGLVGETPLGFVEKHLASQLGKVYNSVISLEVTHQPSKKLRDDGTPFINARVKVRRVVEPGTGAVKAPLAPAAGTITPDDSFPF